MTHRRQFVEIKSFKSNILPVSYGVPQGSILGPLLFLIFINDIPNNTSLNILSFADDTTAFTAGKNLNLLFRDVNIQLNKLYQWLADNSLTMNIEKTKYMIFSPKNNIVIHNSLKINDIELERVTYTKFLGVIVDQNLTWKEHVNLISKKINSGLFVLNRIKSMFPHRALRTLYLSLIHCHLIYGILAWGNSIYVNKLFLLQKRAMRTINNMPYRSHTDPLFRKEKILKIKDIYNWQVSVFVHKYKHTKTLPLSFIDYFPSRQRNILTRQCNDIYTRIPRTNFSKSSFYHNAPKVWNGLTSDLKNISKHSLFSQNLKKMMFENYLENVQCTNPLCIQCASVDAI